MIIQFPTNYSYSLPITRNQLLKIQFFKAIPNFVEYFYDSPGEFTHAL